MLWRLTGHSAATMTISSTTIAPHPNLVQNYGRSDVRFVRGDGVWLEDDQGQRYLDALSGIAVNAIGHGHPALTAAISEQAGQLLHTSNLFHIGPQERLAERLCAGSFGDRVYFCNSGAEANETAYKLLRLWSNQVHGGSKPRIIAAEGSFHGRTTAAVAMTGTAAYRTPFEPLPVIDFVPYGDLDAMAAAIGDDVAGVVLEPMQGEGGVVVPPAGYLAGVRELCDQHQVLLCIDEVQAGIGRTGRLFGHQWDDISPDCMQLAKGLGGGVPIGAAVMTQRCADLLVPGTHASTFGGNHLACAAANAVLDVVEDPALLANVVARGQQLRAGLKDLFGDHAIEVRGRGLLVGVELPEAPAPVLKAALAEGLVCGSAGRNTLRLAPPLVLTEAEADELLVRLGKAWRAINAS